MFNLIVPPQEVLSIRKKLGKTQREMAFEFNVTERAYRRWEKVTGAKGVAAVKLMEMNDARPVEEVR